MNFFQLRYGMALITAISIDVFQFLIGIVLIAAFSIPGVAGAMLGCAAGVAAGPANEQILENPDQYPSENVAAAAMAAPVYNNKALACAVGGAIGGFLQVAADIYTGGGLQGFLIALGDGIADVVDFGISISFGTGLFFLLLFTGMVPASRILSWRRMPFMLAKTIPGIDLLPLYTVMVVLTIVENELLAKRKGLSGSTSAIAAASFATIGAAKAGLAVARGRRTEEEAREAGRSAGRLLRGDISYGLLPQSAGSPTTRSRLVEPRAQSAPVLASSNSSNAIPIQATNESPRRRNETSKALVEQGRSYQAPGILAQKAAA